MHAATRIEAEDRAGLERLKEYHIICLNLPIMIYGELRFVYLTCGFVMF